MFAKFLGSAALCVAVLLATPATAAGPFGIFGSSCCDQAPCCEQSDCCDQTCCCDQTSCCDQATCCDQGGCDSCGDCCNSSCSLCDRLKNKNKCCQSLRCGRYLSLSAGWSALDSYSGESPIIPNPQLEGHFHDGFQLGGAIGRHLGNGLRGEFESAFRSNAASNWDVNGVPQNWDGDLHSYFFMTNLIRDLNDYQICGMTPYVGGGIGLAIFDGDFNTGALTLEIEDEAFAYQGIVGLTRRLSQMADGFVEYRYIGTTDVTLNRTVPGPVLAFGDYGAEFHNVLFGLRIYR